MFLQVVLDGDFCVNMTNPDAMMLNTIAITDMPPMANATSFFTSMVVFVLKNQVWLLNISKLHFKRLITGYQLKLVPHVVVF